MAYTNGQKVSLGTLKVDGSIRNKPLKPWRPDQNSGDLVRYNGKNIEIVNTVSGKALDWIYVEDNGKKLLVCDRCLVAEVSWDNLNAAGLIFGKEVNIDGKRYKLRSLTGGVDGNDKNNEWSRIIELNRYGIGNGNEKWNWENIYTWCQETYSGNSAYRALRGYSSAATWNHSNSYYSTVTCAFRPALEILNAAPLISDNDKNLGSFTAPLVKSYTVSDSDGNPFTITETLDGEPLRTLQNQHDGSFQIDLTSRWQSLSNAQHTLKIVARDSNGEESVRTFTFTKTNTPPTKPIIDKPKQNERTGSSFYVYFRPQIDNEGNAQTFAVETASNSEFSENRQTFAELQKKVDSEWQSATTFTNSELGSEFRIKVDNLNQTAKFLRVSTIDVGGSNSKNYSDIISISMNNVLKIETKLFETKYLPKSVVVNLASVIDPRASIKVEVTNNANDSAPAWENMTEKYRAGEHYLFTNKTKTSEKFAVSVRITVTANDSTSEISINAIGVGVM